MLYVFLNLLVLAAAVPSHSHSHFKRSNTCNFPTDLGLVAVNKDGSGGGWAISKDQTCTAGSWCPYACPPGYVSMQWDPESTSYTYPQSMYGGLKCNSDGSVSKGFSDRAYCVKGEGTVAAKNSASDEVAFCQTVLPGNEEMLIPTNVSAGASQGLAVPGTDYWASTSAHYYINTPGISVDDACTWGSEAKAQGNWAPYVAGANEDNNGNTFIKIGWNPEYLDNFSSQTPSFGVRIICDDESKCNGLQCEIDPSEGINTVKGSSSTGAGDGAFCVVTAEKGASASIEVFSTSSSGSKTSSQILNRNANVTANSTISSTSKPSASTSAASMISLGKFQIAAVVLSLVFTVL